MHELHTVKQLIEQILKECRANRIRRPRRIYVELGELTTYKKEPVLFYFERIKKDEPLLSDAVLDIKMKKGLVRCRSCGRDTELEEPLLRVCAGCGSGSVKVLKGDHIVIKKIEY